MNPELLHAHTVILSAVPVFDRAAADELLATLADRVIEGASQVSNPLSLLRCAGVVDYSSTLMRVTSPLRSDCVKVLRESYSDVYRDAARIFVAHASNGLRSALERELGGVGAAIVVDGMGSLAEDDGGQAFARLVQTVQSRSRPSAATHAYVVLSQFPSGTGRQRELEFLAGLREWYRNNQSGARPHFERVRAVEKTDVADAIANHLLAVEAFSRGEVDSGGLYLKRSIASLRVLEDERGLALALTTLGAVEREVTSNILARAERAGSEDTYPLLREAEAHFESCQDALDEAIGHAQQSGSRAIEAVAVLELAVSYARWGEIELAVELAEQARGLLSRHDANYVRAVTLLASLYRDLQQYDLARDALETAAELSKEMSLPTLSLAKMLNVQASVARREGRFSDARSLAERSIELGNDMGNVRHVAHATHTLARVLGDAGERLIAESLLVRAREMLEALQDERGMAMVDRTHDVIRRRPF
jgi:tetratricopeptide (TPR) repeat protein